ncbi:MAG: hypothetical protein EOM67_15380 [Spirochaetia bacterium]|nr:hypothetical protein [Spirochaetia bacterium]
MDGEISLLKEPEENKSCCCPKEPLETIRKDRGFVLTKWGGKGKGDEETNSLNTPSAGYSEEPLGFDEFLGYMRNNMFTISAMAFQDLMSLDGERLKRCRVHVLAQDDRVIPFCSYNTLYREEDLQKVRCLR